MAATRPPAERSLLVARLLEGLVVAGQRFDLSVCRWAPDVLHPRGDLHLVAFRPLPVPTWVFEAAGVRVERRFLLVHGEATGVVTWERLGEAPGPVSLEVRPLVAFRDHHHLRRDAQGWDGTVALGPGRATVRPHPRLPSLAFAHDAPRAAADGTWYRNFLYRVERERGFDHVEDLFAPLLLAWDLGPRPRATLVLTTGTREAAEAPALAARETARRATIAAPSDLSPGAALRRAADRFLVRRGCGWTVIAGYPWFTDWGRDTMIALPGLTLATGRLDVARSLLETFLSHVDGGMVPNRFADEGNAPEYGTVDGTLWLFEAVRATLAASGDDAFAREVTPRLLAIVDAHLAGTRFGIRVDDDGLLLSGAPGSALTWMDAKVDGVPVTPRAGKPVEIQALWHNALHVTAGLAARHGARGDAARLEALAERARASFLRLFPGGARETLHDVIGPDGARDASLRPNQLLALSLPHPLVTGPLAAHVLGVVERELLTPVGLRTLAPSDPAYRGRYEGGAAARDGAYHQGTVWPWLLGPMVDAQLAVRGDTDTARATARAWLAPLLAHLSGPGLGQLPEVFDGDPPHRPGGCFAQAWSVAEVLRSLVRLGAA